MPRTVEDILTHADELAARFGQYDPRPEDALDMDAITALRSAATEHSATERHVVDAVRKACHAGTPWAVIGIFIGTAGKLRSNGTLDSWRDS